MNTKKLIVETGKDSFVPILLVESAIYRGMFTAANPLKALTIESFTSNCTWTDTIPLQSTPRISL